MEPTQGTPDAAEISAAIRPMSLEEMLDQWEQLADLIEIKASPLLEMQRDLEFAIKQMMEAEHMREVDHPTVLATLTPTTGTPDLAKLMILGEMVPPGAWAKAYTATHEETIQVPSKLNMQQVKALATKYGDKVRTIIAEAVVPGPLKFHIDLKKNKKVTKL